MQFKTFLILNSFSQVLKLKVSKWNFSINRILRTDQKILLETRSPKVFVSYYGDYLVLNPSLMPQRTYKMVFIWDFEPRSILINTTLHQTPPPSNKLCIQFPEVCQVSGSGRHPLIYMISSPACLEKLLVAFHVKN